MIPPIRAVTAIKIALIFKCPGDSTVTLNIQYLVVNVADGSIVGGTGHAVSGSKTVLTNAQITASRGTYPSSPGTPVILIPAPGANKVIVPLGISAYFQ